MRQCHKRFDSVFSAFCKQVVIKFYSLLIRFSSSPRGKIRLHAIDVRKTLNPISAIILNLLYTDDKNQFLLTLNSLSPALLSFHLSTLSKYILYGDSFSLFIKRTFALICGNRSAPKKMFRKHIHIAPFAKVIIPR